MPPVAIDCTDPISLLSFSYRNGSPRQAAVVIDCRTLRNPYCVAALRPLDGRHPRVQDYVRHDPRTASLLRQAKGCVRPGATLAFGCLGGRHRSVAMVELLAEILQGEGRAVTVTHTALAAG